MIWANERIGQELTGVVTRERQMRLRVSSPVACRVENVAIDQHFSGDATGRNHNGASQFSKTILNKSHRLFCAGHGVTRNAVRLAASSALISTA